MNPKKIFWLTLLYGFFLSGFAFLITFVIAGILSLSYPEKIQTNPVTAAASLAGCIFLGSFLAAITPRRKK